MGMTDVSALTKEYKELKETFGKFKCKLDAALTTAETLECAYWRGYNAASIESIKVDEAYYNGKKDGFKEGQEEVWNCFLHLLDENDVGRGNSISPDEKMRLFGTRSISKIIEDETLESFVTKIKSVFPDVRIKYPCEEYWTGEIVRCTSANNECCVILSKEKLYCTVMFENGTVTDQIPYEFIERTDGTIIDVEAEIFNKIRNAQKGEPHEVE